MNYVLILLLPFSVLCSRQETMIQGDQTLCTQEIHECVQDIAIVFGELSRASTRIYNRILPGFISDLPLGAKDVRLALYTDSTYAGVIDQPSSYDNKLLSKASRSKSRRLWTKGPGFNGWQMNSFFPKSRLGYISGVQTTVITLFDSSASLEAGTSSISNILRSKPDAQLICLYAGKAELQAFILTECAITLQVKLSTKLNIQTDICKHFQNEKRPFGEPPIMLLNL